MKTMTQELLLISCANCGMTIALTELFIERRMADHKDFYCPNGHPNAYARKLSPTPKPPTKK